MTTGDKVFATIALTLVVTLSYRFAFASTLQQNGTVLGDEQSGASTVSTNSNSSTSTNDSQSTKTETSTQESTSNSNNNEVSTQNKYTNVNQIQVKTQNAGTATNLQIKTETSAQKSTKESTDELSTDLIELSTEEFSTITTSDEASTETSTELSTSINLVELEKEFGEPVTAKRTTKLEKLFLLIPVEIKTDEIINQQGVTVAEKQSILGKLLDFFSF